MILILIKLNKLRCCNNKKSKIQWKHLKRAKSTKTNTNKKNVRFFILFLSQNNSSKNFQFSFYLEKNVCFFFFKKKKDKHFADVFSCYLRFFSIYFHSEYINNVTYNHKHILTHIHTYVKSRHSDVHIIIILHINIYFYLSLHTIITKGTKKNIIFL